MYVYPMAIKRKKKKTRGDPMELDVLAEKESAECMVCEANEYVKTDEPCRTCYNEWDLF